MRAIDFLETLPEIPGPARETAILEAVRRGEIATPRWVEIQSTYKNHTATFFVSADALRVGDEEDSIRVNVSARTAQKIADHLGCVLPTPKLCDLIWEQAEVRLPPSLQKPDASMGNTSRMVLHHKTVEDKLAGREGLVENVGKHWVLTNRLTWRRNIAANYGWYDDASPRWSGKHRLWQTLGTAHNVDHVDYSQVQRLVQRRCIVDGEERDIVDIMRDVKLAGLVSSEGPLKVVRLPGVPLET